MTAEERLQCLSPAGTPAEGFGNRGERVWYSVDWCGNLIGYWGEDTPPGIDATDRHGPKIIAGV